MRSIFAKDALPMAQASFSFVRTKRAQACPSSKPKDFKEQCCSHYSPSLVLFCDKFHVLPNRCLPVPAAHASLSRLCLYCVGQISWMPLTLVNMCGRTPKSTQRTATAIISGISWSLVVSQFFWYAFPLRERLACSMAVCPMDSKSFSWQNIT